MIKYRNSLGLEKALGGYPYIINNMEIGEIKATAQEENIYGIDGSIYMGNSIGGRTVKIELSILCDNDQELKIFKRDLNRLFNPKHSGKLIKDDKELNCILEGSPQYLTGENNRQTGYQRAVIYMRALDPYYYSKDIYDLISTWNNSLEFYVELTADGIEYATKSSSLIYTIDNGGDLETGFKATITATASANDIYLHNITTGERIQLLGAFNIGDIIEINTMTGQKGATLTRNNITTNIFNMLDSNTVFFPLELGGNDLRLGATTGEEGLQLVIIHREKYIDD